MSPPLAADRAVWMRQVGFEQSTLHLCGFVHHRGEGRSTGYGGRCVLSEQVKLDNRQIRSLLGLQCVRAREASAPPAEQYGAVFGTYSSSTTG